MTVPQHQPLITTIIPTYQRPRLLRRAIKSALNQTFKSIQIIVLDNASGDETARIVAELAKGDPRVRYHCHSENIGAARNFQYGLQHIHTPFFSFLSDDDVLLPEFYEKALEGFKQYPQAMFSSLGIIHINMAGDVLSMPVSNWKPGFYQPPQGLAAMLEFGHPEWTGILFRKEVVEEIGFLDIELGAPSDLDFELRIAARFPFVISLSPGAIFSVRLFSRNGGTYPFDDFWPGLFKIIQRLTNDESLPLEIRRNAEPLLLDRFGGGLLMLGFRYLYQHKIEDAKKLTTLLDQHYQRKLQAMLLYVASFLYKRLGSSLAEILMDTARKMWLVRRKIFRIKYQQLSPELIKQQEQYRRLLRCD